MDILTEYCKRSERRTKYVHVFGSISDTFKDTILVLEDKWKTDCHAVLVVRIPEKNCVDIFLNLKNAPGKRFLEAFFGQQGEFVQDFNLGKLEALGIKLKREGWKVAFIKSNIVESLKQISQEILENVVAEEEKADEMLKLQQKVTEMELEHALLDRLLDDETEQNKKLSQEMTMMKENKSILEKLLEDETQKREKLLQKLNSVLSANIALSNLLDQLNQKHE